MLVQQIMAMKPSNEVETIDPEASVHDAAAILSKKRIGVLVVSDTGTDLLGILSERDIIRELGNRGTGCLKDKVSAVMTREIQTTNKADTAENVLMTMTAGRFRHMPVMADGALIGMVTLGDVVAARLNEVNNEKEALEHMIMGH